MLHVLDVPRAHFHPPAVRRLYITSPEEDATPGVVGQHPRTLYGTRDVGKLMRDDDSVKGANLVFAEGKHKHCTILNRWID